MAGSAFEGSMESLLEGVDATISAWAEDQCIPCAGQKLPPEEERERVNQDRSVRGRQLCDWSKFKVSASLKSPAPRKLWRIQGGFPRGKLRMASGM